uniref:KOW domain-containing protein n=1 Tax=Meloidogyne floridensis TaxID=298350 RepID=A0A915P7K8_9BILA
MFMIGNKIIIASIILVIISEKVESGRNKVTHNIDAEVSELQQAHELYVIYEGINSEVKSDPGLNNNARLKSDVNLLIIINVESTHLREKKHNFSPGDNVEVTDGELANLRGKIQSIDGDKVVILPEHEDLNHLAQAYLSVSLLSYPIQLHLAQVYLSVSLLFSFQLLEHSKHLLVAPFYVPPLASLFPPPFSALPYYPPFSFPRLFPSQPLFSFPPLAALLPPQPLFSFPPLFPPLFSAPPL